MLIQWFVVLLIFSLDYLEDIQLLQQNRYDIGRFFHWTIKHQEAWILSLKKSAILIAFFMLTHLFASEKEILLNLLFLAVFYYICLKQYLKRPKNQPLIYTKRIKRLATMLLIFAFMIYLCLSYAPTLLSLAIVFLVGGFHRLLLLVVAMIAQPLEKRIKKMYKQSALLKLKQCNCIKIGITGSYGKTSIKNILNEVLSTKYFCCATPLSYNNEMGITKTILEKLSFFHEVFICEMGADHLHEIEDLSKMIEPTIGIVSAIGPQHLQTFHSIENILHEKLQLIEHLPKDGIGIINIDNRYLRECVLEVKCTLITVAIHHQADYQARNIVCTPSGSSFEVIHQNKRTAYQIPLLGEHNVLNSLIAIALANELHLEEILVQYALNHLMPIAHRMEIKSYYKATLIDNAYNSNPDSALEALKILKMMPGRHFLITPGFIDLGESQEAYSKALGGQIAQYADTVILVGRDVVAIEQGALNGGMDQSAIFRVATMKEALSEVIGMLHENDTILIENDLPDIFL